MNLRRVVRFRWGLVAASSLLLLGSPTPAAAEGPQPSAQDPQALVDRIDDFVAARWTAQSVTPAEPADDAEFLRRAYLDVAGKIPSASEARAFLADTAADKRRRLVERLVDSPAYVAHFTTFWRKVMMPEASADLQVRFLVPSFEMWLRQKLAENAGYDKMVHEILTTPLEFGRNRSGFNPYQPGGTATPYGFFQAKRIQPDNLAAGASRIFLGIRIECAQCHDHPFDAWKREQFWGFAAFFAGIERQNENNVFGQVRELFDRRELAIPDTDRVVQASYLDGTEPQWQFRVGPRETLAKWLTARENPYFAKATVNRLWGHFFGVGLVDPVDDFGGGNEPSHPELLDHLAQDFAAHDFDLKYLIRALTSTRAYQLSSAVSHPGQDDPQTFARMAVKGMSPEQLFDSLAQAIGYYDPNQNRSQRAYAINSPRGEFLELFANDNDVPTERQTTILQALAMMNGQFVVAATNLDQSQTLAAVAEFPLMSTADRLETLYLATLTRPPRPEELRRLTAYVEGGGPKKDSKQALGDVFWALLNSSEFLFNH